MKTVGLIGGMSWESTVTYYQVINRRVREKMGGLHSARCIVYSLDFAEIAHLQKSGNWDEAASMLCEAAACLRRAGADAIVICTNTMHKVAETVEQESAIPLLHIADATAERIQRSAYQRVGLLGTRYTMEEKFYRDRLREKFDLKVLIPDVADRNTINSIIYDELCNGILDEASLRTFVRIVQQLENDGAQCVILGCTEIGLLLKSSTVSLPLFDTATIHAEAAADWAMAVGED